MDIHALEKVKQQWQSAADLMPQLICLVNEKGTLLHVNRTLEWWGLGRVAEAKGRGLHDILHPECTDPMCYLKCFWNEVAAARLQGRRSQQEAYDVRLNRYLLIRVQPLVRGRQTLAQTPDDLHTVVIVDDVSDLKNAEATIHARNAELARQVAHEVALRAFSEETQARLLTILEKTTDYVAMSDVSGATLYLNPAARALLGLQHDDDISRRSLCENAEPEMRAYIQDVAIPAAIDHGLWEGETRIQDRAGRQIHASRVIIAHRGPNGEVDCLSTILRDISHRVNAEQALRESREELRRVSAQLVSIQEDERRRIALDLHDGLGQTINLIKLSTEHAVALLAAGDTRATLDAMQHLVPRLQEALHDVRRVSSELRPAILDDLGILPTLSWFFREFESACHPMVVEKSLTVRESEIPAPLKITLYRLLQEATSNTVKHAGAARMRVRLYREEGHLHLVIEDDGRGFDPAHTSLQEDARPGLGLVSMKERVFLSGGRYCLDTRSGHGTRIKATWPLDISDQNIEPFSPAKLGVGPREHARPALVGGVGGIADPATEICAATLPVSEVGQASAGATDFPYRLNTV